MNLINLLVKDIIPFAAQNNLDLLFIIKLIDYRLTTIEIDTENEYEVDTYINNVKILNSLFMLMGLAKNYSDQERTVYDNEVISKLADEPNRLIKYRNYKLTVIKNQCANEIEKFDEYIQLENLST